MRQNFCALNLAVVCPSARVMHAQSPSVIIDLPKDTNGVQRKCAARVSADARVATSFEIYEGHVVAREQSVVDIDASFALAEVTLAGTTTAWLSAPIKQVR